MKNWKVELQESVYMLNIDDEHWINFYEFLMDLSKYFVAICCCELHEG